LQSNILLIDDDAKLGELLEEYFKQFDFSLTCATKPSQGIGLLHDHSYDIVILDVMLPEMDGFETLRQIRKEYSVPVLMLTARGETTDRIVGLELGADDYLPKPFEPRELAARINSIVSRSQANTQLGKTASFQDLTINYQTGQVTVDNHDIQLSNAEFDILGVLSKQPQRIFSRDDLFEQLKGHDWDAFNRSIDVTISRLRQKLNDNPKRPRFIKTVFGRGYQFIAQR